MRWAREGCSGEVEVRVSVVGRCWSEHLSFRMEVRLVKFAVGILVGCVRGEKDNGETRNVTICARIASEGKR